MRLFGVPEGRAFLFAARMIRRLRAAKEVFMKSKFVTLISLVLAALALLALAGCHKSSVTTEEDVVVIRVSAEQDGMALLAVMEELQEAGELSFTVSDGMITELNGTKQTLSSYWMLYTNDQENANEQWGTHEYEGEVLGSATLGAGELAVKAGCVYLWSFESFGL